MNKLNRLKEKALKRSNSGLRRELNEGQIKEYGEVTKLLYNFQAKTFVD